MVRWVWCPPSFSIFVATWSNKLLSSFSFNRRNPAWNADIRSEVSEKVSRTTRPLQCVSPTSTTFNRWYPKTYHRIQVASILGQTANRASFGPEPGWWCLGTSSSCHEGVARRRQNWKSLPYLRSDQWSFGLSQIDSQEPIPYKVVIPNIRMKGFTL